MSPVGWAGLGCDCIQTSFASWPLSIGVGKSLSALLKFIGSKGMPN